MPLLVIAGISNFGVAIYRNFVGVTGYGLTFYLPFRTERNDRNPRHALSGFVLYAPGPGVHDRSIKSSDQRRASPGRGDDESDQIGQRGRAGALHHCLPMVINGTLADAEVESDRP